jgi:hypothetical protein
VVTFRPLRHLPALLPRAGRQASAARRRAVRECARCVARDELEPGRDPGGLRAARGVDRGRAREVQAFVAPGAPTRRSCAST